MTAIRLALARGVDTVLDRTVAPGYSKVGLAVRSHLPDWPADPPPGALTGRTAVVTGASSGLGIATVRGLARLGAAVRLVVRDEVKGKRVLADLRRDLPGVDARVDRCDVGDLDDVRRFAEELDAERIDVLVHNAGVMPPERTESAQGHELSMAVHLLGPVLMTELLAGRLAAGVGSGVGSGVDGGVDGGVSGGRVVLVTSGGMYGQRLRSDDPEFRSGDYSPTAAYARSKRAQVELLPVLADRWAGRGIGVYATHPGWAETPGVTESLPRFDTVIGPLLRDADGGADTTVWISATAPEPPSGHLWHDRHQRPTHLLPRTRTGDAERDAMWAWVRESTGI
ncbi:MAG: SDR family NAD(P)-dependent oxidoreductase [Marmoricola sp.]|nr:SDR family NAD(P)-dependent oxidoreductase [Marmoricola sp.]